MHYASLLGESRGDFENCGWSVQLNQTHNWEIMKNKVNNYIRSLNWGYKTDLMKKNVEYYNALASLKDNHTIKLVD